MHSFLVRILLSYSDIEHSYIDVTQNVARESRGLREYGGISYILQAFQMDNYEYFDDFHVRDIA